MTDAIISVVVDQFASFVQQEVKLVLSVRKDVNALTSTLKRLQAVLRDAETRQIKEEAVKHWLEELKTIVYDAEDVLDEWNTRNQGVGNDNIRLRQKVYSCFMSPCFSTQAVGVRFDIGKRIKVIREGLDNIANEKEKFKLSESQNHEELRDQRQRRLAWPMIDVSNIYGREQDKNKLVNWLSGGSSAQATNTHVISIVGTGGFGKTTLANLVRVDGKVKEIFEKRIFVCVSEPFDLLEVARSIIEQVIGNTPSFKEREPVLQCLCDELKGKRFLIVLDDVWTEDTNDWDPLKLAFDGGARGSWVIVTTRNEKVAEMMHSNHIHNLAKLSDLDSWLLFKHIAFEGRQEEIVLKFEEIGKEIVAKCNGVPLVIKIVGSLMRFMDAKKKWNYVLTSKIWEIGEIEKKISPSFFLSYNPLPSNLKQCFMYCAIFPKDTRLYKDNVVKLWMAQGFLGSGGNSKLEESGCDYFDDLAMRSFFQDFERSPDGNLTSCKMHDLVHDFALFLTKGEYSFLEVGKELEDMKVRHLFTEGLESSSIYTAENLRTLLMTSRYPRESVNSDQLIKIFNQLKRIRILDLSSSLIEELPTQVKQLLHLRYLDLSNTKLLGLPETICDLFNLQTLKLNRCWKLIDLPDGIGNLLNLRHLELEKTHKLTFMPRGIVRLRNLRSLSKFIVGNASWQCKISELNNFRYLQGSLMIIGLERLADGREAAQAKLKNKPFDKLSLKFGRLEEGESEKMTSVLENLQPHDDVEELNISSFGGSRFPSWIMLANLLRLTLSGFDYTTKLPALGNLPSLEELALKKMKSLKHIGLEFYGFDDHNDTSNPGVMVVAFRKLKKLVIEEMDELVEWELPIARDNKKIMPCLSTLLLKNCPMLRALPGLGTLESLEDLSIIGLDMIKQVGLELLGISGGDEFGGGEGEGEKAIVPNNLRNICSAERKGSDKREVGSSSSSSYVPKTVLLFPKLTQLKFEYMEEWDVWILPPFQEDIQIMPRLKKLRVERCPILRALPDLTRFKSLEILYLEDLEGLVELEREEGISFLPCLCELTLSLCPSLLVIPGYLFPHTLRTLVVENCPKLRGVQPCLPPLLESLVFLGDVGVFSNCKGITRR